MTHQIGTNKHVFEIFFQRISSTVLVHSNYYLIVVHILLTFNSSNHLSRNEVNNLAWTLLLFLN